MFPTWRYHRTLPACIVATPEADEALGAEWADTPAAFDEPEPVEDDLEDDEPEKEPEPDQAAECLSEKTKTRKNRKRTKS